MTNIKKELSSNWVVGDYNLYIKYNPIHVMKVSRRRAQGQARR